MSRVCPVNADGEHIAPEILLAAKLTGLLPGGDMGGPSVAKARRLLELNSAVISQAASPLAIEQDFVIDGAIPATRYRADIDSRGVVLFFHGGGFVLGSRASHDSYCRRLAIDSGADVVSVEYRLAPENPFPAAVDDVLAAWRFIVDAAPRWGVSTDRLVVAGDSAGGNLAAVLAQQVRGDAVTPCLQLLIYPVTDLTRVGGSRSEFATGYFLTQERMVWFTDHYTPDAVARTDPRASPLLQPDVAGVAPAHVIVAGFDPLRDEGIAYADALAAAGVDVDVAREGALIHGFINMAGFSPTAAQAVSRMNAVVSAVLR